MHTFFSTWNYRYVLLTWPQVLQTDQGYAYKDHITQRMLGVFLEVSHFKKANVWKQNHHYHLSYMQIFLPCELNFIYKYFCNKKKIQYL